MERSKATSKPQRGPIFAAALQDHLARVHLDGSRHLSARWPLGSEPPRRVALSPSLPAQPTAQSLGTAALPPLRRVAARFPLSKRKLQLQRWAREAELSQASLRRNPASLVATHDAVADPVAAAAAAADAHFDRAIDAPRAQLTLAEKLGLVPRPAERLTDQAWRSVKARAAQRGDMAHPCPICQEPFTLEDQLLLSCSHIFHRNCLESYERFTNQKCCPLCRERDYQKMLTAEGRREYRRQCATKIQKTWRMWAQRKRYLEYRRTHPPKDPRLLAKYSLEKLSSCSDRLAASIASSTREIDELLRELDAQVASSRQIIDSTTATFEALRLTDPHMVDWDALLVRACERGLETCAICIMPLESGKACIKAMQAQVPAQPKAADLSSSGGIGKSCDGANGVAAHTRGWRKLALLSCSHVFHEKCIQCFERFNVARGSDHVCPVCRGAYSRVELEQQ
ncbi:RING finger protein 32 [Polyrhizophydium stewartii]|uniref:RING finger protein 32 n=1 Tax=Polyrhizophydium stewartii TaxID=2732419 RepID=A0ABR4NKB7_9FUNG